MDMQSKGWLSVGCMAMQSCTSIAWFNSKIHQKSWAGSLNNFSGEPDWGEAKGEPDWFGSHWSGSPLKWFKDQALYSRGYPG